MRPTRRLIFSALACALLGLAAAFFAPLGTVWLLLMSALVVLATWDAFGVWRAPALDVERQLAHSLPVNTFGPVRITVHHRGSGARRFAMFDHYPAHCEAQGLPQTALLMPGAHVHFEYRLRPLRRGDAQFGAVELQLHARLGLWVRHRMLGNPETVQVYPNFAEVTKYALFATDHRLSRLGVRQRQRRGEGTEFHQLREYRDGDTLRHIDWKATSRHKKLISREYQEERDQQVIFMIDCGRRMRAEDHGVNHFDQCLNTVLLLSYVALRQGDAVGFMTFGGVARWYGAQNGMATINAILKRVYDLHTTAAAADYAVAARELLTRQRKRALVVIVTNTRDEDEEELAAAVRLLRTRHLVLLANLREEFFDTTVRAAVQDFEHALRYSSVRDYLARRIQTHRRLTHLGALALDVTANELPTAVVNRYLEIKRGGRL